MIGGLSPGPPGGIPPPVPGSLSLAALRDSSGMRAALGALAGFSLGLSRGPVPARPRYAALGLGRSGAAARPSPGSGSPRGRLRAPLAAPRCALARPAGYFGLRSGARPAGLGGLPGVALGPLRVGPAPVCAAPRFPLPPPCGSALRAARAPPARGLCALAGALPLRPRAWGCRCGGTGICRCGGFAQGCG